ncbi:hypothetical protein CHUAL_005030 [Chamberlinius hualienensis]
MAIAVLKVAVILAAVLLRSIWTTGTGLDKAVEKPIHSLTPSYKIFVSNGSTLQLPSDYMTLLYTNFKHGMSLSEAGGRCNHRKNLELVNTVRAFPAVGSYKDRNLHVYRFNLFLLDQSDVIRGAELLLKLPNSWKQRLTLYMIPTDKTINETGRGSFSFVSPTSTSFGLTEVDATIPVRKWLNRFAPDYNRSSQEHTLDLAVGSFDEKGHFMRSKFLKRLQRIYQNNAIDKTASEVALVTYSESRIDLIDSVKPDNNSIRAIRSASSFSQIDNGPCRRIDLDLQPNWALLGWGDWIIQPESLNIYQCAGSCGGGIISSQYNPTNHAIVKNQVRSLKKPELPVSCCAPTKLLGTSMLYEKRGTIVMSVFRDLIVEQCSCF